MLLLPLRSIALTRLCTHDALCLHRHVSACWVRSRRQSRRGCCCHTNTTACERRCVACATRKCCVLVLTRHLTCFGCSLSQAGTRTQAMWCRTSSCVPWLLLWLVSHSRQRRPRRHNHGGLLLRMLGLGLLGTVLLQSTSTAQAATHMSSPHSNPPCNGNTVWVATPLQHLRPLPLALRMHCY